MTTSNEVSAFSSSDVSSGAPTMGVTRLVIVGASGMVGSYVLRYALNHPAVGKVTAIGRKQLGFSHAKLKEVLHRDFADCSALAEVLTGQDAAVRVYRCGAGRGAPHDHGRLHQRVRANSPTEQSRRGVLLLEREWRGPEWSKSDPLRALQGGGRERTPGCRFSSRLYFSACLYLPGGAPEGTKLELPPIARDLSRVSDTVPQPGDPGR